MMIMAQHPQQRQQLQPQGVATAKEQQHQQQQYDAFCDDGPNFKRAAAIASSICQTDLNQTQHQIKSSEEDAQKFACLEGPDFNNKPNAKVRPTTNEVSTRQDSDAYNQEQDCKRTLIKNQLNLIEQLQLENANLRNERDQLQLENEEIKFQLQMISSSHILSQPGSAFNERQLEKLVDTSGDGVAEKEPKVVARSATNYLQQLVNLRPTSFATTTATSTTAAGGHSRDAVVTSSSGLAKITATPLRRLAKHTGSNVVASDERTLSAAQSCQRVGGALFRTTSTLDASKQALDRLSFQRQQQPATTRFPADTSSSLASFNVGSLLATDARFSCANRVGDFDCVSAALDGDEQSAKVCLCLSLRYDDLDKVVAAATVIQRAFRKHQICKRFRTITEQLRHTCQASRQQQQQLEQSDDEGRHLAECNEEAEERQVDEEAADCRQEQEAAAPAAVPYASGATRAAAWESLSYAASRLAASAAAATAHTKQALVGASGGIMKSASSQHVAQSANKSSTAHLTSDRVAHTKAATTATETTTVSNMSSTASAGAERTQQFKSEQVVAAAINFQQLESIRKRQYRVGLNIFNKNPEKGICFLIANSFIDASPPYAKNSTSFYLSNQLHFVNKKQLAQHQATATSLLQSPKREFQSNNCQFCCEEENLKRNTAHFLLHRKGLAKEKLGQYLGNLQSKFNQDVLEYYLQELDFAGLQVDVALRKFLSTLRLPGEAQKIERFVDCFAQRYVQCQQQQQRQAQTNSKNNLTSSISQATIQFTADQSNTNIRQQQPPATTNNQNQLQEQQQKLSSAPSNLSLLSKDEIFILTFAIIMLNTDLHSPSLKPAARMSASQFVRNLRGVFKSQTINEPYLIEIYERVKANQLATTPDHVTHVMKVQQTLTGSNFQRKELPNLCAPHRRLVCFCRLFEVYDVNRKERIGQHQREIFLFNDLLLVTKLARRARANSQQQYTYRQSIPLQGLYVQLFQSPHYNLGIRLCVRSTDETLIMFNARNELDQSRFVDDLSESIAEMDEMETIRAHNIVDTIYFKHQERLNQHAMMHNNANNNIYSRPEVQLGGHDLLLKEDLQDKHCDNSELVN